MYRSFDGYLFLYSQTPCVVGSDGYNSDVEFDEDEDHVFNVRLNDAAIEKSHKRHIRPNLPRKEGHYKVKEKNPLSKATSEIFITTYTLPTYIVKALASIFRGG